MKKRIILALAFVLLLFIVGCNSQKQASPAIAEVNGEKLSQSEFDQRYAMIKASYEAQQGVKFDEEKDKELIKNLKDRTYEDLVLQKLVYQDAKKQGIKVSSEEIDSTLNSFKESQNKAGADAYQKFLEQMKVTEKDLRTEIETSQLYQKLEDKVAGSIKVSDADAQKYYNDNKDKFQDPGGIQIYHILVDSEQKAGEVMGKLKQGGDFSALAKEYSADPGSKDKGGDVGLVNETTNFVPEFKQVALALQPGQLNPQAVKSQFGYHIIKAGDKKAPTPLPYEQVKVQLKQQLEKDQKDKAFNTYLEKLKSDANIKDLRQK
ncbi:MAG: SurA N-terminal domain-containing protein [Syntrophomonas sp.]|nr:SurA N-terminal domain-containing protein [Syntrophomonas sp.]